MKGSHVAPFPNDGKNPRPDAGACGSASGCCTGMQPLSPQACAELAILFKALAHPVRVSIVSALARCPGACCGEIVSGLPLAQSTVSQHLAVLREAGLVTVKDEGRCCRYQLSPATRARLERTCAALLPMASGAIGDTPLPSLLPDTPSEPS